MNLRATTRTSLRLRQALHCLAWVLLPALAPGFSRAVPRPRAVPGPEPTIVPREPVRPYLPAVGAPPLRFMVAAPPPDLVTRPPAGGTPPENSDPGADEIVEDFVPPANHSVENVAPVAETAAATDSEPTGVPSNNGNNTARPAPASPPPILPDDTRPAVRPQDFLPFFRLPGTGSAPADLTVVAPVPNQSPAPPVQPPSSATYRQIPE